MECNILYYLYYIEEFVIKKKKDSVRIRSNDKVWDRVFKTIFQEHPSLFVPLINLIFDKHYKRDVAITNINTEIYNRDGSKIMADVAFLIDGTPYHFECQYSDDKKMAFRMFEYDFHISLAYLKETKNYKKFNFPNSCVFYIVPNKKMPQSLKMKITFQDGNYDYTVPIIRLYDYNLDKIEQNELFLFLPFEILRHLRKVTRGQNIAEYSREINSVYSRIIEILEKAYNNNKIGMEEMLTLIDMLKNTAKCKLIKYLSIWRDVEIMLNSKYLPSWEVKLERERKETARIVATDFLKHMKENGIEDEKIRNMVKEQNIPGITMNDILKSSVMKKMYGFKNEINSRFSRLNQYNKRYHRNLRHTNNAYRKDLRGITQRGRGKRH